MTDKPMIVRNLIGTQNIFKKTQPYSHKTERKVLKEKIKI